MNYAVGIDIGGTNTRVALLNDAYEILEKVKFDTLVDDPIGNIHLIKEAIDSFQKEIIGIGVSCPGPLDLKKGMVLTPPNLKKWHYFPVVEKMREILGISVYLENDANLACLAEAVVGAGKDVDIVQFLTISTGVGCGLSIHKQIYGGAHGNANEIANMIMWNRGPSIGDLKEGSIESISSGTAITARAQKRGLSVQHAGEVNDLALCGNAIAQEIMEDAYTYLANAIGAIFALNDPDVIVLSGSVALKIDGFCEKIERLVKTKVYDNLAEYVHIVKAELDEDCGLIGAGYLAFTK